MEGRAFKWFTIYMGVAVFSVIMLAVVRLFRYAVFSFGVFGVIMLIWMMIILQIEERKKKKKQYGVATTALQRKLLQQRKLCAKEIEACLERVTKLEEKADYFIAKLFAKVELSKPMRKAPFGSYDAIAEAHGSAVASVLLDNCTALVNQHRVSIRELEAEQRYWEQLDVRYEQAFNASKAQENKIEELTKTLKERKKTAAQDDALYQEMNDYMNQQEQGSTDGLGKATHQNMRFEDLKLELENEMQEQQEQLNAVKQEIEWLNDRADAFYQLKKEYNSAEPVTELYDEIERLSREIEQA